MPPCVWADSIMNYIAPDPKGRIIPGIGLLYPGTNRVPCATNIAASLPTRKQAFVQRATRPAPNPSRFHSEIPQSFEDGCALSQRRWRWRLLLNTVLLRVMYESLAVYSGFNLSNGVDLSISIKSVALTPWMFIPVADRAVQLLLVFEIGKYDAQICLPLPKAQEIPGMLSTASQSVEGWCELLNEWSNCNLCRNRANLKSLQNSRDTYQSTHASIGRSQ